MTETTPTPILADFIELRLMELETTDPGWVSAFRGVLYQVRLMLILDPADLNALEILGCLGRMWDDHDEYQKAWRVEPTPIDSALVMVDSKS